jgi:hypothetical protein
MNTFVSFVFLAACTITAVPSILSAPLEKSVVTRVIDDGFSDVCHGNAVTSNGVLTSTCATTGSRDISASLSLDSCIGNIDGQLTP